MNGEQHRFKIKCKCAILIQKSARRDSIVSNSNSTVRLRRLFRQHRPIAVISQIEIPQRSRLLLRRDVLSLFGQTNRLGGRLRWPLLVEPTEEAHVRHEATGVHHAAWHRSGSVAAFGARAAA
jgi:hypothetical protein